MCCWAVASVCCSLWRVPVLPLNAAPANSELAYFVRQFRLTVPGLGVKVRTNLSLSIDANEKDHPEDVTLLRTQLMSLVRRLRRESRSDEKSWAQLMLLGAIDRHGGEATPSLLAESERMRSSNLAAALRELEADGLLVRTPDAEDKRRVRVRLTPAGLGLLQQSRTREAWLLAAMESCLTEQEQAQLIEAGR